MRLIALLSVAAITLPFPVAAQQTTLDSMGVQARRLRAAADAAASVDLDRRARLEQLPRDTVRFDPFTVVVRQGDGPRVSRGTEMAAAQARELLGDGAVLLRDHPIEVAFGIGTTTSAGTVPVIGIPDSADAQTVADAILRWAGPLLTARGSAELRAWATIPVNVNEPGLRRSAHVDLVTAIPGVAARCIAGAARDCAISLGLVFPDDPATAYWDSAGRWEMGRRTFRTYSRGDIARLVSDCVTVFRDEACVAYLRRMITEDPSQGALALAPLGNAPRQTLLLSALELGGPGALGRLLADSSRGAVASIEAAAGLPLDSVLLVWRQQVVAARPEARLGPASRTFTLIWSLVFAGMALGGTRWRAG